MCDPHDTVSDFQLELRPVEAGDLERLFTHQSDPQSLEMAVVYSKEYSEFIAHWERVLVDPTVTACAILVDEELVGHVSCFLMDGLDSVGYWIDRGVWGRGIASRALEKLLADLTIRPLHARVAASNHGSIRVLEKCGFREYAREESPDDGKFPVCLESLLRLDAE